MNNGWPLLALAGLGAFHGLNPAMGWLFATALGMHRQSRMVLWLSLLPIAAGHAFAIAAVAGVLAVTSYVLPHGVLRLAAGASLIAWAAYHWRFSHRHRVRFGMQVSLMGLAAWSFVMSIAHGAGLMVWPVLMPVCVAASGSGEGLGDALGVVLAGVGLHTVAMLATTAVVAAIIYEWLGLSVLRSAWVNFDLLWVLALAATGASLLLISGS